MLVADGASLAQTAPADDLQKPLECGDLVVTGEGLNDLLNNVWKEADLLFDAVPELLRHRHVQILQVGGEKKLMGVQFLQDQFQGVPEALLIFNLVNLDICWISFNSS